MVYIHDAYTISKRTLQARKVPKNVVVGVVLGVIAVTASAVVLFLLFRLRQWRLERRADYRVDLLGSEAGDSSTQANDLSTQAGDPEKALIERPRNKPLPPIPSATSSGPYAAVPGNTYSQALMNETPVVRQPLQTSDTSLPGSSRRLSLNFPLSPLNAPMTQLPTKPTHARTSTTSSIGNFRTYNNNPGLGLSMTSSSVSNFPRGQLTIANATDADAAFDRSQSSHLDLPPYSHGQTRGRDPPFPAKQPRPKQLRSILKPASETSREDMPSNATTSEKQGMWDTRSTSTTSYMVQIPIPRLSRIPASPVQPERSRKPLTLTTSRPVSNVVIEDTGPIRRPNGSRGNARMVTMSVLVDDSDNSGSELGGGGRDSFQSRYPTSSASVDSRDVLGEVLKGYTTDLPPYTPSQENTPVP
jgi:hypothetical protein